MLVVTEPKIIYALNRSSMFPTIPVIYNLNANTMDFTPIYLMPPQGMLSASLEFDQQYINLILTNDNYFMQLMRIIIPLQQGQDVYILAYNEESVFNPITETLMKFIQQRYGYNYQEVHSLEDFNPYDTSSFSTPGILQYDEDFKRYEANMMKLNPYLYIDERINDSGGNHG